MRKSNTLVRIKETYNQEVDNNRWHYDVYITTFKDYLYKTSRKVFGGPIIELYPYKWYEISYLYDFPTYMFLNYLFTITNFKLFKESKLLKNVIKIIVGTLEIIITSYFVKLFKFFLNNYF